MKMTPQEKYSEAFLSNPLLIIVYPSICTHFFTIFFTQQENESREKKMKWNSVQKVTACKICMFACFIEIIHFTYIFNFFYTSHCTKHYSVYEKFNSTHLPHLYTQ